MRSSRVSRETAALVGRVQQLDSMQTRRVTRSALARFAYEEPVADIEDIAGPTPRKRRRIVKEEDADAGPSTSRAAVKAEAQTKRETSVSSRTETAVKAELPVKTEPDATTPARQRRLPARVIRGASPSVLSTVEPPTDWEEMYDLVRQMRLTGPARDAAVDTMGCDRLFTADASPRNKRFHILVALMLSSQTKDTVNAVAMNRLHTELPPHSPGAAPGLNVENVLAVDPAVLNALIRQVGFHNNKTKYLKAAAITLRDNHNSDIPDTIAGLTALPGVGPKMAHLCLSAAWDKTEGIGVDVHVHRITNMWGWHKTSTPEATRVALESWLPRDKWREINTLLVGLGQTICPSQAGAKRCGECELGQRKLCAGADKRKVLEAQIKAEFKAERGVKVEAGAQVETAAVAAVEPAPVAVKAEVKREVETRVETQIRPQVEAAPVTVKAEVKREAGAQVEAQAEAAPVVKAEVKTEVEAEAEVTSGGSRPETAPVAVRTLKAESVQVKAETSPDTPAGAARPIKTEVSPDAPPVKVDRTASRSIKPEFSPDVAVRSVKPEPSPAAAPAAAPPRAQRPVSSVKSEASPDTTSAGPNNRRIKSEALSTPGIKTETPTGNIIADPPAVVRHNTRHAPARLKDEPDDKKTIKKEE